MSEDKLKFPVRWKKFPVTWKDFYLGKIELLLSLPFLIDEKIPKNFKETTHIPSKVAFFIYN